MAQLIHFPLLFALRVARRWRSFYPAGKIRLGGKVAAAAALPRRKCPPGGSRGLDI